MKKSALYVVLSLALLSTVASPFARASVGGANPRPEAMPSDLQLFAMTFMEIY